MAKFNKDSVSGTVTVVVLLSLVCSIVVSGAAVALKSKQDEQKALDVQRNILTVAGLMKEDNASVIKDTYSKFIEPRLVDLQSGDSIPKEIRYLKYLESFSIQSNANRQTRTVHLGEEICELEYLKNLKK